MFERFTDDARQAVVVAQEQARALRHSWIGTEHLLLGVAARILRLHGIDTGEIRTAVEDDPGHTGTAS